MPNDKLKSYLHLHLIVFIWGFTAVLGALISLDAVPLVWYRMLLASILIFGFLKLKKKKFRVPPRTLLVLLVAGLVIAMHWLTFFSAIKVSNVSITLAVLSTGAFFTSILEPIFYKRKIIFYEVFFGIFVIIGLYIIFQVETRFFFGMVLALISALLSSIFSLINGKMVKKEDASVISFYELGTGTLAITVYLLFMTFWSDGASGFYPGFFHLSFNDFWLLFVLGSICTAYAVIVSVEVMKHLSPYTVMLTINLEPIYGIVLAFFIFGSKEEMSPDFYYGALIILITVVLNGLLKNRKKIKQRV
ncbi:MAG TPA: DMT family transporter [Salinimicrobium sp.]|nr:DMT family transporter [Salinimicrobium sp.]